MILTLNTGDRIIMQQSFDLDKSGSGWYCPLKCYLLDSSNNKTRFNMERLALDLGLGENAAACFERVIKELFGFKEFVENSDTFAETQRDEFKDENGKVVFSYSFSKSQTDDNGSSKYDFSAQLTVEDNGEAFNIRGKKYKVSEIMKAAKAKGRTYGNAICTRI